MSPCRGQARNTKRPGQRLTPPTKGGTRLRTLARSRPELVPHGPFQSTHPALWNSPKTTTPNTTRLAAAKAQVKFGRAPCLAEPTWENTGVHPRNGRTPCFLDFRPFPQVAHGAVEYRQTFSMNRPSSPEPSRREAITAVRGSDPTTDRGTDHLAPRHPRTAYGSRRCLSAGANAYGAGWPRGGRLRGRNEPRRVGQAPGGAGQPASGDLDRVELEAGPRRSMRVRPGVVDGLGPVREMAQMGRDRHGHRHPSG